MTDLEYHADRRRYVRTPVNRSARLLLGAGREDCDCTVLDESTRGIQVDLSEAISLPDELIIRFSPDASQLVKRCWSAGTRAGLQFIARPLPSNYSRPPGSLLGKKILDYTLATSLVIILLPLFIGLAIAVKLDSKGPVLFRQPRRGFQANEFNILKFRSMHEQFSDFGAERQTMRDDPRLTRIGKWIRRLSLDELPQLINVMRGEMSFVGPRPHATNTRVDGELLQDIDDKYLHRYCVKPGITGWAQVNGARGVLVQREDLCKRIAYDLEYIERISVWFDLKVILLTFVREIISTNAF